MSIYAMLVSGLILGYPNTCSASKYMDVVSRYFSWNIIIDDYTSTSLKWEFKSARWLVAMFRGPGRTIP